MREALDRISEARTAVEDLARMELPLPDPYAPNQTLRLLIAAKYHLWHAAWLVIDAARSADEEKIEPMPKGGLNP